jgi:hypothetical protein
MTWREREFAVRLLRKCAVMLKPSVLALVFGASAPALAGELDLNFGLQATHTEWSGDAGGGPVLGVGWWFTDWVGASFVGKEHYAQVDDRYMSYFSLNATFRHDVGPLWLGGSLGLVHQHEETMNAINEQPIASAFGVADGLRHRMASRAGVQLALPIADLHAGHMYLALDIDGTYFAEEDRGPRWMNSVGISLGVTRSFSKKGK